MPEKNFNENKAKNMKFCWGKFLMEYTRNKYQNLPENKCEWKYTAKNTKSLPAKVLDGIHKKKGTTKNYDNFVRKKYWSHLRLGTNFE